MDTGSGGMVPIPFSPRSIGHGVLYSGKEERDKVCQIWRIYKLIVMAALPWFNTRSCFCELYLSADYPLKPLATW